MSGILNRLWLVGSATILGLAGAGCAGSDASEVDEGPAQARVVSVQVITVQPEPFTDFIQVVGNVEANRDVVIAAEESGTIRELLVEKGARVAAGQPIVRIDDSVLRPQAEQAASEAALASETWERQRRLWEEDRVGSEIAYLQARYRAETAEAGARAARERLARTVVRAPIPGILDDRMVEVGTLVGPGTPLARVIDAGSVKISGGVPERYAGQIVRGTTAQVVFEGQSGGLGAQVSFVGSAVESSTRTFPMEIIVPNPTASLKPGMIANVRLERTTVAEALVVPQEAVMRVEDGYIVYVALPNGAESVAEARPVTIGAAHANRVIVDAGLRVGDQVVVVGQNRLATGDRLQIVPPIGGRPR